MTGGRPGLTLDVTGGQSEGLSPASAHGYRAAEVDPRGASRGHGLVFYDLQPDPMLIPAQEDMEEILRRPNAPPVEMLRLCCRSISTGVRFSLDHRLSHAI